MQHTNEDDKKKDKDNDTSTEDFKTGVELGKIDAEEEDKKKDEDEE